MPRSITRAEVGSKIGAHVVTRVEPFPEIEGQYIELEHPPTGARHIHIAAPDDNNMFSVLFPTVPTDSTGVAHILEHVALMGSERFDVHGTFYKMGPRSLNTFLNASTSPDTTQYYFTTRNEKDYYNLLAVYLDAAFFPKLEELTFKQEGHRLEFATMDDPSSDLIFKGVVFNEMKGQMSTPAYIAFRSLARSMFPDLTYANSSGGDPEFIPDLTWEQLRSFHARHYHPSNSYFFTYGDLPLTTVIERIEDHVLSRFDAQPIDVSVPDQPRYEAPRRSEFTYPLAAGEPSAKKSQVTVAWLTEKVTDSLQTLTNHVLSHVLVANASSPLRRALIDSGLGEALSDITGFVGYFREGLFCAGLKGTDPDKAGDIEQVVLSTLETLVKEGIDPAAVEAAIHRAEISSKEVSNEGGPYSLKLFSQLRGRYIYGGDPYAALRVDEDMARLREKLAAGSYLEDHIRKWFLDNPHRVTVVLRPDHELQSRRDEKERSRLDAIRATLTDEDIQQIIATADRLKIQQDAEQDLSALPTLELSDITLEMDPIPQQTVRSEKMHLGLFPQPTNGLTYVWLRSSFAGLTDEEIDLASIYSYCCTRSGAGRRDYLTLAKAVDATTGGISASASTRITRDSAILRNLTLRAKALVRNHEGAFDILTDILTEPRFTPDRLRDLIKESKAQRESALLMSGHLYAMALAASTLDPMSHLDERLGGISHLQKLKELADASEDELEALTEQLAQIGRKVWAGDVTACITTGSDDLDDARMRSERLAEGLSAGSAGATDLIAPEIGHLARTTSAQVAYNARAYRVARIGEDDAAALHVLSAHMRSKFLLRELRQKGGAYGAGTTYDREAGIFTFYTYRDPNISETFERFDASIEWASGTPATAEELKEAILTTYRGVDPLLSPDTKGGRRFFDDLAGYSIEVQTDYRRRLLSVTPDDLIRAASSLSDAPFAMATISGVEKVEAANASMGSPFEVAPI